MKRGKKEKQKRVSEKISKLRGEDIPQEQSVAMALNMERQHRLGRHGKYRRVKRGSRRK